MIYPIGDKVVIKRLDEGDVTSGGVILPDTTQEALIKGEVMAVGPGTLLLSGSRGAMQCKIGDTVVFQKHGARKVELEGEEFLVIREPDLETIIGE
jgi:chaperonin GroES